MLRQCRSLARVYRSSTNYGNICENCKFSISSVRHASKKKKTQIKMKPDKALPDPVKKPPVITIMGHVDHGKTTLIDTFRQSNIVGGEFGGITQHIGAFSLKLQSGDQMTILDTPGHAAFSAMRSRGAQVTDIIVLVVAGDDGPLRQTQECIQYAQTLDIPLIVAVNKIDKSGANVDACLAGLKSMGVVTESLGGDVIAIPISALHGTNLDQLIEAILTQAELLDLKAQPIGPAHGTVIEAKLNHGWGKVATVLVQGGTLVKGAYLTCDLVYGKVRAMFNEDGKPVLEARPSEAVEVIGWKDIPTVGETFKEFPSEREARAVCEETEKSRKRMREEKLTAEIEEKREEMEERIHYREAKAIRDDIRQLKRVDRRSSEARVLGKELYMKSFEWRRTLNVVETGPCLNVVVKSDVEGSLEAILDTLGTYDSHLCDLKVGQCGVGPLTLSEVETAAATNSAVLLFNLRLDSAVASHAKKLNVKVYPSNVIYRLFETIKDLINERVPVTKREVVTGECAVSQGFTVTEGKKLLPVAGCQCVEGMMSNKGTFRVVRRSEVLYEGPCNSIRHFKKTVDTISKGMDCGICFDADISFSPGDSIVCLSYEDVKPTVDWDTHV